MATEFDLASYTFDSSPKFLWRVIHANTQSRRDNTGDVAAESTLQFHNEKSFIDALRSHFNWSRDQDCSCFLSLFSDKSHALSWARERDRERPGTTRITKIDTSKLPRSTLLFKSEDLKDRLGIDYKFAEHEFLIFKRIPEAARMRTYSLQEFEREDQKYVVCDQDLRDDLCDSGSDDQQRILRCLSNLNISDDEGDGLRE